MAGVNFTFFESKYSLLYKTRPSLSNKLKDEKSNLENTRRNRRQAVANSNRNLDVEPESKVKNVPSEVDKRKIRLENWKNLKKERMIQNKKDIKKPFVVGVVRHRVKSPVRSLKADTKPTRSKSVPTAQTRGISVELNKENVAQSLVHKSPSTKDTGKASSLFKTVSSTKKLTKPQSPTFMQREAAKKLQLKLRFGPCSPTTNMTAVKKHSSTKRTIGHARSTSTNVEGTFVNDLNESAQQTVTYSPAHVSQRLPAVDLTDSPQDAVTNTSQTTGTPGLCRSGTDENMQVTPPNYLVPSPFVAVARGKSSVKRKNQAKYCQSGKKISSRAEPADGPAFQRARLKKESSRLLALAKVWENFAKLASLRQDVYNDINAVVGLTRLLVSKKLGQFGSLIERHEAADKDRPVTLDDLNGFWGVMYFQIADLYKRYSRLEQSRSNNWEEREAVRLVKKRIVVERSSVCDFAKGEKRWKRTTLIKQSLTPRVELQDGCSPARSRSLGAVHTPLSPVTAQHFGSAPTVKVSQSNIDTPTSCLKTKRKDSMNKNAILKKVFFFKKIEHKKERDESETPAKHSPQVEASTAPRRSARLSTKYLKQETS